MRPAVCFFSDSLSPSGVGEHMVTLAAGLRDRYDVSMVCPPSPGGSRLLSRARDLGVTTLELEVRGDPDCSDQLQRWVTERGVDLLHVHAGVAWEGHEGVRVGRAAGLPVLRTEHLADLTVVFDLDELPDLVYSPYHLGDRRPSRDQLAEMVAGNRAEHCAMVRNVDLVIGVSSGVRDSFVTSGVPADKTRVVRNGITPRPPTADVASVRGSVGVADTDRVVLTTGRLIDVKGHSYLLDAVPAVVDRHPDVRFVWVGDGPLREELGTLVAERDLKDAVLFAGHRTDVPDVMASSDLFVLPSFVEGLPLSVLEAMGAGLPVVGTRVVGTTDVILDRITGRLVPPGRLAATADTTELSAAIDEILSDPGRAEEWGRAGEERLHAEFTTSRMADETAAVYGELLD